MRTTCVLQGLAKQFSDSAEWGNGKRKNFHSWKYTLNFNMSIRMLVCGTIHVQRIRDDFLDEDGSVLAHAHASILEDVEILHARDSVVVAMRTLGHHDALLRMAMGRDVLARVELAFAVQVPFQCWRRIR